MLFDLFTPQSLELVGYCRTASGGQPAGDCAGGCSRLWLLQACGRYISETTGRIFSIRSSMNLSTHLPHIGACPWANDLSNLVPVGCRLYGMHNSETVGRISSVQSSLELFRPVVVHCQGRLPIRTIWACPWGKKLYL